MKRFLILLLTFALTLSLSGCQRHEPQITLPPNDDPVDLQAETPTPPQSGDTPTAPGDPPAGPDEPDGMPSAAAFTTGLVAHVAGSSFLLAGENTGELYFVSTDVPVFNADETPCEAAVAVGQIVEVGYSGNILETYPAQLGAPSCVRLTGEVRDTIPLYRQVFDDLWETDPALNSDITYIAFDLQGAANLNDGEKAALVYLIGCDYGKQTLTGTFNELCEQGYIDEENLHFENGILFSFSVSEDNGDTFTFDAEKWRSGLGAYFFSNCTAKRTNAGWTYEVGAHMIA